MRLGRHLKILALVRLITPGIAQRGSVAGFASDGDRGLLSGRGGQPGHFSGTP